jgi:hypothetical protein
MIPQNYNYGSYLRGDTIPAKTFQVQSTIDQTTTPVDLTNASIKCNFILGVQKKSLSTGNGITVTDAAQGEFQIDAFVLNYAGTYKYDIQFLFDDGSIKTYISGICTIINDVTK